MATAQSETCGTGDLVELTMTCLLDKPGYKSWLVSPGGTRAGAVWLPKKVCQWDGETRFWVPEWLAYQKGLH